jgi:alanyl-tRNA synthetase
MQQHSGQHVLSAAIEHLFRVATVSFHLGADASTIDLSREMSALELAAAESEANRIVWEDRPVAISFASPSDAAQLPLRKESVRQGPLRLIAIRDYDLSACGGTHVASTGAIGMIVLDRVERFKGGQRLEFLCGRRVLDRFRALRGTTDAAARLLSTSVGELPEALARLQTDAKELRRAADAMRAELVRFRADALAVTAEPTAAGGLVLRTVDDDAAGLRILAAALAAKHGLIVVLVSIAAPTLVVVARSADVALNAQEVLATLMARFGGRGGGRADLAQGGGLNAAPDAILDQARRAISAA